MRSHIVIERSVYKLTGLVAICAAFVALGVWMINGGAVSRGEATIYLGWVTTVFSGFGCLVLFHRLVFGHRKPVELSPQGFLDRRVLAEEVPWSAVSRISVWSNRGNSLLRVQLTDEAVLRNKLTPYGKAIMRLNKSYGVGIYISSDDLEISFSALRRLFQKYLSEYNPAAIDDTK